MALGWRTGARAVGPLWMVIDPPEVHDGQVGDVAAQFQPRGEHQLSRRAETPGYPGVLLLEKQFARRIARLTCLRRHKLQERAAESTHRVLEVIVAAVRGHLVTGSSRPIV